MQTADRGQGGGKERREKEKDSHEHSQHRHHRDKIGPYAIGAEIGRGSFATVYKAQLVVSGSHKSHETAAVKIVSRQKLTTKLLENLESEINILKAISHRNIVGMKECYKSDSHIYLIMEYCSGGDLSMYIKNRGRLPTLDYYPRGISRSEGEKIFYPHPPTGGLNERVTRCFLGQLAQAVQFLRSQDLIHRDIKPQNLLLQPASSAEISNGHPYGIPLLKVADFGFARILPAAAMAETLCGSPLYMAPEILRYEKYDAKADLWSVGAVLFEMAVGRPPFRANNHVELLRRIEKGEDRIKFPDESSKSQKTSQDGPPPIPVPADIKALVRGLLKRHAISRMGFEDFFGSSSVWNGHMTESNSTEDGSMSFGVSTESSVDIGRRADRIRDLTSSSSSQRSTSDSQRSHRAPQPLSTDPALNPRPAPEPPVPQISSATDVRSNRPVIAPSRPPVPRSEPKYYVSDDTAPSTSTSTKERTPTPPAIPSPGSSRPITTPVQRRMSGVNSNRDHGSLEEPPIVTPSSNPPILPRARTVNEGSPLAATPPINFTTGKDESALENDDSVVGREYVVVEKRTVEVNALADELDRASRRPADALVRRPSSRTSVVTRPVSSFKPSSAPNPVPSTQPKEVVAPAPQNAIVTQSYSPPFALAATPPFAISSSARNTSATGTPTLSRSPSVVNTTALGGSSSQTPQTINIFPPTQLYDPSARYSTSPSSLQTGALARALTNTAIRLIGTSANAAGNVLAKAAASRRRPTITRTSAEIDPDEEDLLRSVEDYARKGFVLFELADQRLLAWQGLAQVSNSGISGTSTRRKSSSSSINSEVAVLRQQEIAAGEAVVLYCKALTFIVQGTNRIQRYWERRATGGEQYETSSELNDMVQWLRARFNECYEKAEWAKSKCADELPFVERLLHDKARDMSRHAAVAELQGDFTTAESGYESSLWLLQALLDNLMYSESEAGLSSDDRIGVEKLINPVKTRLEALKVKMSEK